MVLITGADDAKFTAINDSMAEMLPNAVRVAVSGAGHNVHFEKPVEVTDILMGYANDADWTNRTTPVDVAIEATI